MKKATAPWKIILGGILMLTLSGLFWRRSPPQTYPTDGWQCRLNLKALGTSFRIYANDYDDRLPVAAKWTDALQGYLMGHVKLHCPGLAPNVPGGYAMDSAFGGRTVASIAATATGPLVFDADPAQWNLACPATECRAPRHQQTALGYFLDGSAREFH